MNRMNVIDSLSNGLKHERLAYKIVGIVLVVCAAILIVCGIVSLATGSYLTSTESANSLYAHDVEGYEFEITDGDVAAIAGVGVAVFGGFYLGAGFSVLAIGIVNLILAGRAGKHRLSDDATINHAGSVGSIVLAAFFNEIALIFVIFNFVKAKKNRALLAG